MSWTPIDRVERAYREHGAKLWRALVLYSGDPDVASEAVAEAFAQALEGEARIESVERWVWRTAFLLARRLLRDRKRLFGQEPERTSINPDVSLDLQMALRRLSLNQRAAIVLFYFADLPMAEVARRMGTSSAAVGVHLHRARRHIKAFLEAE